MNFKGTSRLPGNLPTMYKPDFIVPAVQVFSTKQYHAPSNHSLKSAMIIQPLN